VVILVSTILPLVLHIFGRTGVVAGFLPRADATRARAGIREYCRFPPLAVQREMSAQASPLAIKRKSKVPHPWCVMPGLRFAPGADRVVVLRC
jgi:hypothetical protein